MNKDLTTLKITKNELAQLEKIKELLLSEDYETRYLGYKMFVNTSFYKRCKPKSLIPFTNINTSLFQSIILLKYDILKYESIASIDKVYYIYNKYINNLNNLCRLSPVKILIPEEKEMFKKIYENLSISDNEELIQNSKKQLLESKTIQNNRDKFFKHDQSLFSIDSISGFINEKGSYYNTLYYTRRVLNFLNYLLCDSTKFYERIPINIIIEE